MYHCQLEWGNPGAENVHDQPSSLLTELTFFPHAFISSHFHSVTFSPSAAASAGGLALPLSVSRNFTHFATPAVFPSRLFVSLPVPALNSLK